MRLHVLGYDDAGRPAVVTTTESATLTDLDVPVRTAMWSSAAAAAPAQDQPAHDLDCEPGTSMWRVVRMDPHRTDPIHHTETVDFDVVLEGEISILLPDEREIALRPGDCVLIPGVPHGWSVGEAGCVLSVFLVAGSAAAR